MLRRNNGALGWAVRASWEPPKHTLAHTVVLSTAVTPGLQRQERRSWTLNSPRPQAEGSGPVIEQCWLLPLRSSLELSQGVGRLLPAIRKLCACVCPYQEVTSGPVTVGPCRTGLPFHLVLIIPASGPAHYWAPGGGWGAGEMQSSGL